ncbi:MAG: hypothetical protein KJ077_10835 [Anaerolineae bacterium]|nr:hypothetical protein [Anaerolineae bacterium]
MEQKPTKFQHAVLQEMAEGRRLFSANRQTTAWLEGSGRRVPFAVKLILKNKGWIEGEPDTPNRPHWRTNYRITEAGRQAIGLLDSASVGLSEEGEEQLTGEEIKRQDFVDNIIHTLFEALVPEGALVEHNIEAIAQVRESVQAHLVTRLGLMSAQEFYPFIPAEAVEANERPPCLVVLTYRTETDGLKVGLFNTEEEAEAQAIAWIKDDYFQHTVQTMDDIRRLESEGGQCFAIDICFLSPGETWGND